MWFKGEIKMNSKNEIKNKILFMLKNITNESEKKYITDNEYVKDILSSLEYVNLLVQIEDEFKITVYDDFFAELTVDEITELILKKICEKRNEDEIISNTVHKIFGEEI